jgi:peroxiredoxin
VNPKKPKLPHPTAVVVDSNGVIRFIRQDVDYRHRPPASELLDALDKLK